MRNITITDIDNEWLIDIQTERLAHDRTEQRVNVIPSDDELSGARARLVQGRDESLDGGRLRSEQFGLGKSHKISTQMSEPDIEVEDTFVESETTRGVLYVPRVPPYMHAQKLRHLMEGFGSIGRIYLTPEDDADREKRLKSGGQKKTFYKDGWIEFNEKKIAKRVCASLNGTPVGGKKGHNFYRDDIWTLRYLPKFTWSDLREHLTSKKDTRSKRLDQRIEKQVKADEFFLKNVQTAKTVEKAKRKKIEAGEEPDSRDFREWTFKQKGSKTEESVSDSLLANIAF